MNNLTLITGGARSGKSEFAEKLAIELDKPVIYIATMVQPDHNAEPELIKRIELHKRRRPTSWQTIETDCYLANALAMLPSTPAVCLLDCLTCYIANVLDNEQLMGEQINHLLDFIQKYKQIDFIVVTGEVGSGVIPDNALARHFIDKLGEVNAKVAKEAGTVWLSCVGLQLKLK